MNYADPWDEMARLEGQMENELLARLKGSPPNEAEGFPGRDRVRVTVPASGRGGGTEPEVVQRWPGLTSAE